MSHYEVYWIHKSEHTSPLTEGYVGITKVHQGRGKARLAEHFRKLRLNSHPNPKLQNAFNKNGTLEHSILQVGSEQECLELERTLRPRRNVAWNIMEGGNIPPSQAGRKWFTNGKISVKAMSCPDGFTPGRIIVSGPSHGHYGKPKNYKINYSPEFLARAHKNKMLAQV